MPGGFFVAGFARRAPLSTSCLRKQAYDALVERGSACFAGTKKPVKAHALTGVGVADEIRTRDILNHNQVLYH